MQACKPGSVSAFERISIIYLALPSLTGSNGLPFPKVPKHVGAGSSRFGIYLAFQLLGFAAVPVARKSRELLPHVFTFSSEDSEVVCFLWHFPYPALLKTGPFPLGSRIPCAARTFLSPD